MKYLLLFLTLFCPILLSAQKADTFRIDSLPTEGVLLDKGWKFQVGDNTDWAKPDFDDTSCPAPSRIVSRSPASNSATAISIAL